MRIQLFPESMSLAQAAAGQAATAIRLAIESGGTARIVAASAASQIEFLAALTAAPGVDWRRVELFQLDEYIGLPSEHPASFRRFLQNHLLAKTGITAYWPLDGFADPVATMRETGQALLRRPIDLAFAGIGENGHLAFNDPPADFETPQPYLAVKLDEACRRQQVAEGWFPELSAVPTHAITMSIRQISAAREIIAVVPGSRKARAVADCLNGAVTPLHPASVLQRHPNATVYLDRDSASLLKPDTLPAG